MKIEKIKNLTPHEVVLLKDSGLVKIKSNGMIRVTEVTQVIGDIDGVKVISKKLSDIPKEAVAMVKEILSDQEAGIIVSMITAKKIKEMNFLNSDELERVFIIGKTVRNKEGQIIGAESLAPISTI